MNFGSWDGRVACSLVPAPRDALAYRRHGRRLMFLTDVYTSPGMRRTGCGRAVVTLALAYAAANGIDVCAYAHSHGRGSRAVSDHQLEQWYASHGFRKVQDCDQGWMVWYARGEEAAKTRSSNRKQDLQARAGRARNPKPEAQRKRVRRVA